MTLTGKNVVIVGGGLPALFSALVISEKYPTLEVHVVERQPTLGGLYNSYVDERVGFLDQGMHVILETCIPDADRHIREAMAEEDWIFLTGNHKDIAGIFYNGRLHEDSPYIDLLQLPAELRRDSVADLCLQLGQPVPKASECSSAQDYFRRRFGASIADRVIEPILNKLWNTGGASLDAMASRIVLMDRVLLYDAASMAELMACQAIRSRIGFPDQMELPLHYRSAQRGLYPRRHGMVHVIQAIERRLVARGARMHKQATVDNVVKTGPRIGAVRIKGPDQAVVIDDVSLVHWTIPIPGLLSLLNVAVESARLDPPNTQAFAYFLLRHEPKMAVYSFYCFDAGHRTFRVTNFSGYCPDARGPDGTFLVCVEMHFAPSANLGELDLAGLAAGELLQFGIIDSLDVVAYSRVEVPKVGFPVLTSHNSHVLGRIRERVESLSIENLITAGQAPERGIFFLHEILEQSYNAIARFEAW